MALRLIVMRHAKSSWKRIGRSDHERSLNKRGREAAPAVAKALLKHEWVPELVLSSDATRTQQTWEAMEPILETSTVVFTRDLYLAGFSQAGAEIASHAPGNSCVLLLGHNPGWETMVTELSGEYLALKTADAVLLEHPGDDWTHAFFSGKEWRIEKVLRARNEIK